MNIEIAECKEDSLVFTLKNVDVSIVNALRRVMVAEVPTLAIDTVNITKNNSAIHDEMLAHRIGLLPIHFDERKVFNYTTECECDTGCDRCVATFILHAKHFGPEKTKSIYSDDFVSLSDGVAIRGYSSLEEQTMLSKFSETRGILIAVLGIGEEIKLEALAKKGTGKIHAKWSPVSIANYKFNARITLPSTILEEDKVKLLSVCPTKVFYTHNSTIKINANDCIFCNECTEIAKVETMSSYTFTVETTGAMPASYVVQSALKILSQKMRTLKTKVEESILDG